MIVGQSSTTGAVPFYVAQNSGDYHGAPGAMPTVKLSKNGGPQVAAFGEVVDAGNGLYWLMPDARDRDVVGEVVMLITAPSGDIAPPAAYCVQPASSWQQLLSLPGNIASIAANVRLFTTYNIPPAQQGLVQ